jgi:hypothetical protein
MNCARHLPYMSPQRDVRQAIDLSPSIRGFARNGFPALNVDGMPRPSRSMPLHLALIPQHQHLSSIFANRRCVSEQPRASASCGTHIPSRRDRSVRQTRGACRQDWPRCPATRPPADHPTMRTRPPCSPTGQQVLARAENLGELEEACCDSARGRSSACERIRGVQCPSAIEGRGCRLRPRQANSQGSSNSRRGCRSKSFAQRDGRDASSPKALFRRSGITTPLSQRVSLAIRFTALSCARRPAPRSGVLRLPGQWLAHSLPSPASSANHFGVMRPMPAWSATAR